MVKKYFIFFYLLLFFSLLTCSDPTEEKAVVSYQMEHIELVAVPKGVVLSGNVKIPFVLSYNPLLEVEPDSFRLELVNAKTDEVVVDSVYLYDSSVDNFFKADEDVVAGSLMYFTYTEEDSLSHLEDEESNPAIDEEDRSSFETEDLDKEPESLEGEDTEKQEEEDLGYEDSEIPEDSFVTYSLFAELPKQEEGVYFLRYFFYKEAQDLGFLEIPVFFSENEVKINTVELYPSVVSVGGEALIVPDFTSSIPSESYVRISLEEKVVYAGSIADLGEIFCISAPEKDGIYLLVVEIFPFAPDLFNFDFISPYVLKANFFVRHEQSEGDFDFKKSEGQYSLLHHFRGEFKDYSGMTSEESGVVEGDPLLDLESGFFGYRFGFGSALRYDEVKLPIVKGQLMPFSLMISAFLDGKEDSILFETKMDSFSFQLRKNKLDLPYVKINYKEKEFVSAVPDSFKPSDFIFRPLTLSCYSEGLKTYLLWFKEGQLFHKDIFDVLFEGLSETGETVIGGGDSSGGIIDELAVYIKDSSGIPTINSQVFNSSMKRDLKKRLLFVEGFDSLYLSDYGFKSTGDLSLGESQVQFGSNSSLEIDIPLVGRKVINGTVDFYAENASGIISVLFGDGEEVQTLFLLDLMKKVLLVNGVEEAFWGEGILDGYITFSIVQDMGFLNLSVGSAVYKIHLDEKSFEKLTFLFEMNEDLPAVSEIAPVFALNALVVDDRSSGFRSLLDYRSELSLLKK